MEAPAMEDPEMEEQLRELEKQYCPPLEPTLVRAICSDGMGGVNALLGALRLAVVREQAAEMEFYHRDAADPYYPGSWIAATTETDDTQLFDSLFDESQLCDSLFDDTQLGGDGSFDESLFADLFDDTNFANDLFDDTQFPFLTAPDPTPPEPPDTLTKQLLLAETFPTLRLDLITHTLRQCGGDVTKTTDELLNHAYLEEEEEAGEAEGVARGIDAFSEEHHVPKRARRWRNNHRPSSDAMSGPAPPTESLSPAGANMQIIPQYAPIPFLDQSGGEFGYAPLDPSGADWYSSALPATAVPQTTASLAAARDGAFASASTASRRGRSDPLMNAAAGYYAQVGHDYTNALHGSVARDADALAATQSSASTLDLHGLSVDDAVRIAKQRTSAWWIALGEQTLLIPGKRVDNGYSIVTGVGRHSAGGRGKLGPAVVKALLADGWRVEVIGGGGEVLVVGKARRY